MFWAYYVVRPRDGGVLAGPYSLAESQAALERAEEAIGRELETERLQPWEARRRSL